MRYGRSVLVLTSASLLGLPCLSQEARFGFNVPVTFTAGMLSTPRLAVMQPEIDIPANHIRTYGGIRLLLNPSLKLGANWFAYSSIQIHSTHFFPYEAYYNRQVFTWERFRQRFLQLYFAYRRTTESGEIVIKTGKLTTAFGSFSTRYDDKDNALIDRPMSYEYLQVRANALPCSNYDFEHQQQVHPNVSAYHCVNPVRYGYGIFPVTLYGLPGAEINVSHRRLDLRLQLTNSSPSRPRGLRSPGQYGQWAGGGGYTFPSGLRVGFSAFHGPWLDPNINDILPRAIQSHGAPGLAAQQDKGGVRQSPATGLGIDAQWARGRWSFSGEWHRFEYRYPYFFRQSPAPVFGYVEVKTILNPRWYLAVRGGFVRFNQVEDLHEKGKPNFLPNRQIWEGAIGFRPNRLQLLKVGYQHRFDAIKLGPSDSVFAIQLVTSAPTISKGLR